MAAARPSSPPPADRPLLEKMLLRKPQRVLAAEADEVRSPYPEA